VHATLDRVDWPAIRDRIFGRLDPIHDSAAEYRREGGVDVYTEPARFIAPTVIQVGSEQISADTFVVATGSRPVIPPTDGLSEVPFHTSDTIMRIDDLPPSLIIIADRAYRTSVPGVWTLGDATNHFQLKHMANAEARIVRHNLLHPDDLHSLTSPLVPHAVLAEPQVASVGLTERAARERGVDHVVSVRRYADTAYGWALEDTTSFVKLLADPGTRLLLGAHLIGPQAAILIQPLLQAMTLGETVDQIAHEVLYIHPALTEVVEQALLAL
jgi:mycothione reductase